tara:strand:- start:999 stop:1970 length:972 start_codon:yes stop_codon:yes gene_type:complete
MKNTDWKKKYRDLIDLRLKEAVKSLSSEYAYEALLSKKKISSIISTFWEAMQYSLTGGKRIRGILVILTVEALCGKSYEEITDDRNNTEHSRLIIDSAAAIECIHAFSLVHDDLPCLDDDELRRGRPSCHVKFGEAMAMLVGDALQTMAFQILTSREESHLKRFKLLKTLSWASGANGMAGCQVVDIAVVKKKIDLSELKFMHRMKTGALLEAAVSMGLILSEVENQKLIYASNFVLFAKSLGLAFQIVDDILDATGKEESLGKKIGRDSDLQKPNFVQLLGVHKAQKYADKLIDDALTSIKKIDSNADALRTLAKDLTYRNN